MRRVHHLGAKYGTIAVAISPCQKMTLLHMQTAFTSPTHLPSAIAPPFNRQHSRTISARTLTMSDNLLFASRCIDKPNSQTLRANTRAAHLQWASDASTNLIFAGPLRRTPADPVHGSLVIMSAPTEQAASDTLAEDPYNKANLFETVTTHQWKMGMASDQLPEEVFLIWCQDKQDSLELRQNTRPRHLQWWKASARRGIIGPFPCEGGANGTLIVCEGQSVEEVVHFAATDPYNQVGLFESVDVSALQNIVDRVSKNTSE